MILLYFALFVFLLNIPFGYWRSCERKFSLNWLLAIHIPVLFIISIRILFQIKFSYISIGLSILSFFFGQLSGKWLKNCLSIRNL